jgi:GT2 family glycosyltransferase
LRIRQAGWKVIYDPRFTVTHLGGQSQPQRRATNQLYYQSMIKFYAKHYGSFKTHLLRCLLAPYRLFIALQR